MPVEKMNRYTCDLCGCTKIQGIATEKWAIIEVPDKVYMGCQDIKVICKNCAHNIEKARALNRTF